VQSRSIDSLGTVLCCVAVKAPAVQMVSREFCSCHTAYQTEHSPQHPSNHPPFPALVCQHLAALHAALQLDRQHAVGQAAH